MHSVRSRCHAVVLFVAIALAAAVSAWADVPDEVYVSPAQWAADHGLPLTLEVLNAIERGARMGETRQPLECECTSSLAPFINESLRALREGASLQQGRGLVPTTLAQGRTLLPPTALTQGSTAITSLYPGTGDISGGTRVSISGLSFQQGAIVGFGGVLSPSVQVYGCTYLSAVAPAHGAGMVDVAVVNPDSSSATLTNGFTYASVPPVTVTSVSLNSGPTSGGTSVTITGSGFGATATVYFISASGDSVTASSVAVVNSTTITATTPPGMAGLANVYVYTGGSSANGSDLFTYTGSNLSGPAITSFNPSAAPGSTITITGTNFVGVRGVKFASLYNGLSPYYTVGAGYAVNSSTQITATVPTSAVVGPIEVDTVFGIAGSCGNFTPVPAGAPTITSISPSTGSPTVWYVNATPFIVTGTNLVSITDVKINGKSAAQFNAYGTSLYVYPDLTNTSGTLTIEGLGGTVSSVSPVTVTLPTFCSGPAPTITSISSSASPGGTVTINGTNLVTALTYPAAIFSGAARASFLSGSATQVLAPLNADAMSGQVSMINDYGMATSGSSLGVTLLSPPTISSLSETTLNRTRYLTINGTNLAGVYEVGFGAGATGALDYIGHGGVSSVVLRVPWSGSFAGVAVLSQSGAASASLSLACNPPAITGISPPFGSAGRYVTVTGTNFTGSPAGLKVLYNGRSTSAFLSSNNNMSVYVPPGAASGPITIITPYGSATSSTNYIVVGPKADFNGDGKSDVIWRNSITGDDAMWLMNGVTITSPVLLPTVSDTNWKMAGVGDFDGDGKADVIWRHNLTGQVVLWLMNGTSLSSAAVVTTVADLNWKIAGVGDVNNDGKSDVFWRNSATGQTAVWLMNGASISSSAFLNTVSDLNYNIVGVGDFNGDGMTDVFWRNGSTGENVVWLMNGASVSSAAFTTTVADLNYNVVGVGDATGDGKADVVWRNQVTGDVVLWVMNGATVSSAGLITTVSDVNWHVEGVGDFNGDGKVDLFWRDVTTGETVVWLMNGLTLLQATYVTTVNDLNWSVVAPR